jgi:hypothetical protein
MEMWRAVVPLAVGVVVAVIAAIAACGLVFAATWSSIHSGATDRTWAEVRMALFSVAAFATPPALGFLAGWGTYRIMGRRTPPGSSN